MEYPYCNAKMEEGKLKQDRYALKWKSNERRSKNVKLTSFLTQTYVDAYLCRGCNKIIIDINTEV